ncbi:MAG TPA: hypothetical protein VGJ62_04085 [Gemmatimonadaceae bacterium]
MIRIPSDKTSASAAGVTSWRFAHVGPRGEEIPPQAVAKLTEIVHRGAPGDTVPPSIARVSGSATRRAIPPQQSA